MRIAATPISFGGREANCELYRLKLCRKRLRASPILPLPAPIFFFPSKHSILDDSFILVFSQYHTMKTLRLSFLLLSPLLLVACASTATTTPQANQSQLAANSFQPEPGMAGLYIFEEGSLIRADISHRVSLDGQALGIVSSSSYVYSALTPVSHTITLENSTLTVNAVAGQNYFVREKTHLDAGGQILTSTLFLESAKVATADHQGIAVIGMTRLFTRGLK